MKWEKKTCEITRHDATPTKRVQTLAHPHVHNLRYHMQIERERERDVPATSLVKFPFLWIWVFVHGTDFVWRLCNFNQPNKPRMKWFCRMFPRFLAGTWCGSHSYWLMAAWDESSPVQLTSITQTRTQLEECVSHCRSSDSSSPAASLPDHSPGSRSIKLSYIL